MKKKCDGCGTELWHLVTRHYREGKLTLCYQCRSARAHRKVAENKALRAKLKPINRKRLIKSRGDKCEWCGDSKHDLELHHIVRVIDGGTNAEDNLLVLCSICHHSLAHRGEMANNR